MRALLTTLLVALIGAAALWWGTDQGRALTAEAARRLEITAEPRLLPDVTLHDQRGEGARLSDYRGAPVVLEFIYATCPDICIALGTAFEQLEKALPGDVGLLSISFDPDDGREELAWFAERHSADAPRWRVAGVEGQGSRENLLDRAGVIVIPDKMGGFVHNAGLYLVDAEGRLKAIFDLEDVAGVQAAIDDAR